MRVWAALYVVLLGLGAAVLLSNDAVSDWDSYVGHFPDIAADKYTTEAAWDGTDPYVSMDVLARRYDFHDSGWPAPAPRTPATFILHAPLLMIPDGVLLPAMLFVTAALVVFSFHAATTISGGDGRIMALACILCLPPIYAGMVLYGSATMVVPCLVVAGWRWIDRPRTAGLLLGVAAALKLWPGIVLLALLSRRDTRTTGLWAVAAGGGITALGLLLPGASVTGTVDALFRAKQYFDGPLNVSATSMVGWPAILVCLSAVAWGIRGSKQRLMGTSVVAGLLASPVTWPYYWLAATPVLGHAVRYVERCVIASDTVRASPAGPPPADAPVVLVSTEPARASHPAPGRSWRRRPHGRARSRATRSARGRLRPSPDR